MVWITLTPRPASEGAAFASFTLALASPAAFTCVCSFLPAHTLAYAGNLCSRSALTTFRSDDRCARCTWVRHARMRARRPSTVALRKRASDYGKSPRMRTCLRLTVCVRGRMRLLQLCFKRRERVLRAMRTDSTTPASVPNAHDAGERQMGCAAGRRGATLSLWGLGNPRLGPASSAGLLAAPRHRLPLPSELRPTQLPP